MLIKALFLDFDGIYSNKIPDESMFVITNMYQSQYVYNVSSDPKSWNVIYNEFISFMSGVDKERLKSIFEDYETMNMHIFKMILIPIGEWIIKIKDLIDKDLINFDTEIYFSSFCDNRKLFGFDAEGETNGQFLYKKSYFLSYYLYVYLKKAGFEKIIFQNNRTFESKFNFYLRGIIIVILKLCQIVFYKLFIWQRDHLHSSNLNIRKTILTSRGLIQTQFAKNIYDKLQNNILLIINESSSKPFRNLKEAKKNNYKYYYAEGNITFKQLYSEVVHVINLYRIKDEIFSSFFDIDIDICNAIQEFGIYKFHIRTYTHMLNNSIHALKRKYDFEINRIISMEMLSPFSYYIKKFTNSEVYQLQTTSMRCAYYPSFVYGDKFFFSDKMTYLRFMELNLNYKKNIYLASNIKYIGLKKKSQIQFIRNLTYFSQPIYEDEENKLIFFLRDFCLLNGLVFNVKFHPRAKIPRLDFTNINIVETIDSLEVIQNSDIIATRTSSIGVDCWFLNAPILFFVNGIMKRNNFSYIPEDYLGTIENQIDIHQLSQKINTIIANFYKHPIHDYYTIDEELLEDQLFR